MALTDRIKRILMVKPPVPAGRHIDPLSSDAPAADVPSVERLEALRSPEMAHFRDCLTRSGDGAPRDGVLQDLADYHGLDTEACLRRCLDWEGDSVTEWEANERSSREGLLDFYRTTQSWAFDLLWYAYLQTEGYGFPASVLVARWLAAHPHGIDHADVGSGVGVTSQLLVKTGHRTTAADVSTTLLDFARFRLERRGVPATYHDLSSPLPAASYDVITALDTLTHVPDIVETAEMLHGALRPNGYLFANFDVRQASRENAWHLYNTALPLRHQVHRTGFVVDGVLDGYLFCYRRVESVGWTHQARAAQDWLQLGPPAQLAQRAVRRGRPLAQRLLRRQIRSWEGSAGSPVG